MSKNIDFHAHILPGCDHGSDSVLTSLRQLAMAKMAGVDVVCATPHFYPAQENVDAFLRRRDKCWQRLRESLGPNPPKILLGAEVLAFSGMERMEKLEMLCLKGTRCLLLEMPSTGWSDSLLESVEALHDSGRVRIVLAHADRYDRENVDELIGMGISVQLNVSNASRRFGISHLEKWMAQGTVVALGSDIHGTEVGYSKWQQCQKRRGKYWDRIMARTWTLMNEER